MKKNIADLRIVISLLLILLISIAYIPIDAMQAYADDGDDTGLTLELLSSETSIMEGEPVYVKAGGDPRSQKMAWVGLYKRGEVPGSGIYSLRWYYVGEHEGERINILDSAWTGDRKDPIRPGEYTIFLFGSGDYDVVKHIDITITEDPNKTTDGLTLELVGDETSFVDGQPVYIKASGDPDSKLMAWVGLYKKGEVPGSGIYSLRWYYVGAHEGEQVNIVDSIWIGDRKEAITPGDYTIFIFGDNDYSIVDSIDISITEDPDKEPAQPSDELTLNLVDPEKTTYKLGEELMIIATGSAEGAWVGLYKENETPRTETPSLRWYYINDGYNGVKVNILSSEFIRNNSSPITEGEYKILLFDADSYDNLITEIHVKIEGIIDIDADEYSLETDKTEYAYKESIRVRASGTGIGNSAWVGLYPADTITYGASYLYYYYVKDCNNNWTIIQNRTKGSAAGQFVGDGKYKLVIFADGGYNYPVKSVEISVVRDLKSRKVLRDPGCVTFGLEYVTYEDDTSEYREIPTLGGHIWSDPIKVEGQTYHKYICDRNEDHVKKEACSYDAAKNVIKPATVNAAGSIRSVCDVCGGTKTVVIPQIAAVPTVSATEFIFNGKTQRPAVSKIIDSKGKAIDSSMYTITYPASSYAVGSYVVSVKFKGNYEGSYNYAYTIQPDSVTLNKLKKGKKSIKVNWTKAASTPTGYQIAYSRKSNFSNVKYKNISADKTSAKLSKLKGKKKYFVKVRAYKVVNGKTYYSAWSTTRKVKTKK